MAGYCQVMISSLYGTDLGILSMKSAECFLQSFGLPWTAREDGYYPGASCWGRDKMLHSSHAGDVIGFNAAAGTWGFRGCSASGAACSSEEDTVFSQRLRCMGLPIAHEGNFCSVNGLTERLLQL